MRIFCLMLFLASIECVLASATTINVPADQPTIQAGIDAASNGDTVLVAPGTYVENINFQGKAITVTSSGGPSLTIIDGSNSTPTVTFANQETFKSQLSGFTVRNGYPNISISNASATIRGNVIGNTTAFYVDGIDVYSGSAVIQGNLIVGNGNGIYTYADTGLQVVGNIIALNTNLGLALGQSAGPELIQQNTIFRNSNTGFIFQPAVTTYKASIIQNVITLNGMGAVLYTPFTLLSNTIFSNGNSGCCQGNGSEVTAFTIDDNASIQNNLIVGTGVLPAFSCETYTGSPTITNNDIFSVNSAPYGGSCADQTGTNGNISADPLFVDTLLSDLLLQPQSPAINAGINSVAGEPPSDFVGNKRTLGGTIDIGADEYAPQPRISLSPLSLNFPPQDVGTTSTPQIVTAFNHGGAAVNLNLIATGSSFSQTNNCGSSIAAHSSCQISVTFSPLIGGTVSTMLGVFMSATLNPQGIELVGTGLAPQIQIGCCFYFYNQVIYTSNKQTETITNIGQAPLLISGIVYSGAADFVETNDCPIAPNSLAVGGFCTLTVTYTPTIVGYETGTITVTSNAGSPQVIYLNGTSVSAGNPILSPTSLTFPLTLIGQSSAPQTLTLTNAGTSALGISQIYSYGDFQETNDCPSSLAVNANCTITVTYVPSIQGNEFASLYVYTDSLIYQVSAALSGTGTAPAPTISSLSIANTPTGSNDTFVIITGTGFINTSQVLWNGSTLCCASVIGSTQIFFTIPATSLTIIGTNQITVSTPSPGGGTSNAIPFTVYTPFNYAVKSANYSYRIIAGTNLNLQFDYAAVVDLPFPVQFGGGSFSRMNVSSAGNLSFINSASGPGAMIPYSLYTMLVAPFWANLYPFGSGTDNNVFWEVIGNAPNRELVVEWRNVGICCETTRTIRFEIVFFEGSNNILFNYADTIFGGAYSGNDNGATASSGVQVSPTIGTQFSYNQPLLMSKTALLWYPDNPTATLSTSSIGFGYHQIGTPTLPQAVTLTNGGLVPLAISGISSDNPDFTQTNDCGSTLPPHRSCSIRVVFRPSQPTAETATLSITDDANNSPQTVSLTGIGSITSVVVFPILVNFGSVSVGSTATAPVVLANASNQTLSIQQISAAPAVYTQTNNCGNSLAPGLSCTVTVSFTPTQVGSVQGTLSMGLNGKPIKVVSHLTGSGS